MSEANSLIVNEFNKNDVSSRGTPFSKLKMYKNKFGLVFLLSLWTTLLYSALVVDFTEKQDFLYNYKNRTILSEAEIEYNVKLDPNYCYLLKIKYGIKEGNIKKVLFNGKTVPYLRPPRKYSEPKISYYFKVSPVLIEEQNSFKIYFDTPSTREIQVSLRNYRKSYAQNEIVVLFRSTAVFLPKIVPSRLIIVFVTAYIFLGSVFFIAMKVYRKILMFICIALCVILGLIAFNNTVPLTQYLFFVNSHYFLYWFASIVLFLAIIFAVLIYKRLATAFLSILPSFALKIVYSNGLLQSRKVVILTAVLSITPFLLLHGMWLHSGMYPVDIFDEAAHTFTEIPIVQKAFLNGHILKMNFFNNFGTPLLGDAVANPFALHSLTYFFCKPHIAMIINKSVLWVLTFLVLFYFYKRRSLSFYSSILCGLLAFTNPAFLWFYQNHPHQGVLFYFTAILLLIDLAYSKQRIIFYILLHLGFIIFLLSSGIMGIFLGVPFVLVFTLFFTKFNIKMTVKLFLLPLISALILIHPHILYFAKIAPLTWRSGFSFENVNPYTFFELLRGCTFLSNITGYHTDFSINCSLVVLIFVLLGFLTFKNIKNNLNFRLSLILGLIPFLFVVVLLRYRWIQSSIPVIKPIDATRTLWFAGIFLMIPLGLMFDRLTLKNLSPLLVRRLLYLIMPLLLIVAYVLRAGESPLGMALYILSPIFFLSVYYLLFKYRPDKEFNVAIFGILLFASIFVPRIEVYEKIVNLCYNTEEMMSYAPVEFVEHMEQNSRLSSCQMPSYDEARYASPDQKIAKYNIFGSAGRSIITHGGFRTFLEKDDLITFGWLRLLYYFKVNSPDQLAKFGVRYLVTEDKDSVAAEDLGWEKVSSVKDLVLFESPLKPSPFYYTNENQIHFIHDYKFFYDRIEVNIPSVDCDSLEVVATFICWPGWKASIDNKPVKIYTKEDQFIRIGTTGGHKIILEFSPYSNYYIWMSLIASFIFLVLCCFFGPTAKKLFKRY